MLITSLYDDKIEAGLDEAGRGCLAGSLFAGAVILPKDFHDERLNDSKKLTRKQRDVLRELIIKESLAWAVSEISAPKIDQINILNSSFLGMEQAVLNLKITPDILLVDGNRFRAKLTTIPYECIIKGDGKIASIAAASILAKTFRDEYIEEQSLLYPQYNWENNKGYPTVVHRKAIEKHGITPLHRKTFCSRYEQGLLF